MDYRRRRDLKVRLAVDIGGKAHNVGEMGADEGDFQAATWHFGGLTHNVPISRIMALFDEWLKLNPVFGYIVFGKLIFISYCPQIINKLPCR
jgi:hypothetical protein